MFMHCDDSPHMCSGISNVGNVSMTLNNVSLQRKRRDVNIREGSVEEMESVAMSIENTRQKRDTDTGEIPTKGRYCQIQT